MDYDIDFSEIAGKRVECPPECGMCCLCQPEVLPEERQFFRRNFPENLVKSRGPEPYTALALKKGRGSCAFLNGRRCKVYQNRPTYCRQFPFHLYASDRLQVELDLSCRGAWTGQGVPAMDEARDILARGEKRIAKAMAESRAVYSEFYANCREAGVMADPSGLRMSVSENLAMFCDPAYLGRIMDAAQIEPVMSLRSVQPDRDPDMGALEEAGMDTAMESMSSQDPLSVPVYCDGSWNWNMFMAVDGKIEWMVMDDEGELHHRAFADASDIRLRFPDAEGTNILRGYVSTLNGRDSFMGSVFSLMDENAYEDDMTNSYYGCLSVTVMDLLWRMSMLDHFMGTGCGADGVREAVIFYDMDRLDAPTIGAFV
ncbi:MAG: YkgJ family cysteine cluster protein [Thermoplasmata archaeon]|nr:YkgJ family cysteine cluster protein [Thermoplasmata archaeon]